MLGEDVGKKIHSKPNKSLCGAAQWGCRFSPAENGWGIVRLRVDVGIDPYKKIALRGAVRKVRAVEDAGPYEAARWV